MEEWMTDFAKYLKYQNPVLVDQDEENEPSPTDLLQAAIIRNLQLFADKDEEPFLPYLSNFATLVWNLLVNVTALPKHDVLATTSIRFLSSLVKKLMHKDLFKDEATLRQIVGNIVIPNLMFRESDEERFEDDPSEFVLQEVEGSSSETRRRCSQDLLKAMCFQFENETTAICSEHVTAMLAEANADPANKWAAKDAAVGYNAIRCVVLVKKKNRKLRLNLPVISLLFLALLLIHFIRYADSSIHGYCHPQGKQKRCLRSQQRDHGSGRD